MEAICDDRFMDQYLVIPFLMVPILLPWYNRKPYWIYIYFTDRAHDSMLLYRSYQIDFKSDGSVNYLQHINT